MKQKRYCKLCKRERFFIYSFEQKIALENLPDLVSVTLICNVCNLLHCEDIQRQTFCELYQGWQREERVRRSYQKHLKQNDRTIWNLWGLIK